MGSKSSKPKKNHKNNILKNKSTKETNNINNDKISQNKAQINNHNKS